MSIENVISVAIIITSYPFYFNLSCSSPLLLYILCDKLYSSDFSLTFGYVIITSVVFVDIYSTPPFKQTRKIFDFEGKFSLNFLSVLTYNMRTVKCLVYKDRLTDFARLLLWFLTEMCKED